MKKYIVTIEIEEDVIEEECIDINTVESIIDDALNDNGIDCVFSIKEK